LWKEKITRQVTEGGWGMKVSFIKPKKPSIFPKWIFSFSRKKNQKIFIVLFADIIV